MHKRYVVVVSDIAQGIIGVVGKSDRKPFADEAEALDWAAHMEQVYPDVIGSAIVVPHAGRDVRVVETDVGREARMAERGF